MFTALDASELGALLDYFISLFHDAEFPLSLCPRIFQETFQGGQDVRRALWGFALLSCLADVPLVFTPLCQLTPQDGASSPWNSPSRDHRLGLLDLAGGTALIFIG